MPAVLFDIPNPPSNNIILDDTRKGRIQFTVNNVSGRPLTRVASRLSLLPDAAAPYGKWLKLDPSGFREFKIADSLQYMVEITVPESGAAGNYAFRLDVWDDANPDDTLVNGPTITFSVPTAPPPPVKPPFPWWIPIVAVAVIVLVVGAVLILKPGAAPPPTPTPTSTPTVTSTPLPTATATPKPPPTRTPIPTPVPGRFTGHWNLGGDSQKAGAIADLQQTGVNVVGTYFNGNANGVISGIVVGDLLAGQFRTQFGSGTFQWTLTGSDRQFQGTWSDTNAWCGWRDGSSQPNPCKPSLIRAVPIDIRDKVLKITLVAPSP